MIFLSKCWRWIAATRYTRALEAEVARLRAENRALLNSILGIAGVPPIPVTAPDLAIEAKTPPQLGAPNAPKFATAPGLEVHARGSRAGSSAARAQSAGVQVPAPVRRRSWQQINRMLEFESAKKKPQEINS